MAVITLSREYGSGGDEIARMICQQTGYQTFNKELIEKAAVESGFSRGGSVILAEREYRVTGFLDRLLGNQPPAAQLRFWHQTVDGVSNIETLPIEADQLLDLVQKAVTAAYRQGDFVIVGRGGQAILRDLPGVLHVRVIASLEERILRVRNDPDFHKASEHPLSPYSSQYEIRRVAQSLMETHDTASEAYLKHNYGVNWADPSLYDVIINTSRLRLETAAAALVETARQLDAALQAA